MSDNSDMLEAKPYARAIELAFPYNAFAKDMKLDPGAKGASLDEGLLWLAEEGQPEEVPRIFAAAVLLFEMEAGTFGECLQTAIIWERG